MPRITVEIEWDVPDEPFWLNPDNVALALGAYCRNTAFTVRDVDDVRREYREHIGRAMMVQGLWTDEMSEIVTAAIREEAVG